MAAGAGAPQGLMRQAPLSLYVHFPWCVRKCPYCDFNSYTAPDAVPRAEYLAALERDLAAQAPEAAGRPIASLFMGGGTPSLFAPEDVARVLAAVRAHLTLLPDAEITLEANPGAVERGAFGEYRAVGVNRVSLGAQSFDAAKLAALGRIHSPGDTRTAAEELHAAGLSRFNLDLMYALPGQDVAGALADLEAALELAPAHLSHYQLTIEAGTVFAGRPPPLPDEDLAAAMLEACLARLSQAGFSRYEVSAYARAGQECRHNLNYWRFGDYLGVGAGAHGKLSYPGEDRIVRTQQTREPRRYMAASPAALIRAEVDAQQRPFEFMLNALRQPEGFEVDLFHARTGLSWNTVERTIDSLQQRGLIGHAGTRYFPTPQGLLFLNDVLLHFLPHPSRSSP